MLRITNGIVTISVTKGAFKSFYQYNGFHPVSGEDGHEEPGVIITHPTPEEELSDHFSQLRSQQDTEDTEEDGDDEEDTEEDIDLSEIPLGEMSFYQLNEYADQLELDHDGIRSKKELRALIRGHLRK